MAFEGSHSDAGIQQSPGGFEFGIQGWTWGPPVPKSVTFFLDNTAMVCDQYGRQIRRAVLNDGREVRFADTPPEGNTEGMIVPRPQFASHAQTIQALKAEGFNWLAYDVKYVAKDNRRRSRNNLAMDAALKEQQKLIAEGNRNVTIERSVECVGWPQLSYEELKAMPQLPPTPVEELVRILDKNLRAAAVKVKSEWEQAQIADLPEELREVEDEE